MVVMHVILVAGTHHMMPTASHRMPTASLHMPTTNCQPQGRVLEQEEPTVAGGHQQWWQVHLPGQLHAGGGSDEFRLRISSIAKSQVRK